MKKNLNIANRFCQPLRPSLHRGSAASQLKGKEIKERHTHNFYSGLRTASQSSSVVLELSETVKNENAIKFHCIYWKWMFRVKNVCWSTDIICTYNHFVLIHRIRKLLCKKSNYWPGLHKDDGGNQLKKPRATRNVRKPCKYNMPTYSLGSRSPYNKHLSPLISA